jgi:HAD superfamily hydrolase (TIGR01509 family)
MLKAVLFDLDDTLIDWSGFGKQWEARERALLRGVFDYVCSEVHSLNDFDGMMTEFLSRTQQAWEGARSSLRAPHIGAVMVEALIALGVPPDSLNERRCLEAYKWGKSPGTRVFPDVIEALTLLRKNNVQIGIVTNAYQPMWMRDTELEQHGLLPHFSTCRISAADVGFLKPHPAIFEHALNCIGTKPNETVFVGDNPVADIAGAQGAGMQAVLRITHPTPPMLSGLIVPDHAVNSLAELPDILDQWHPGWR